MSAGDPRGPTRLAWTVALAVLVAVSADAQEGDPDRKPDLELPEVIIRGIDESRLGVGEVSALREPEAKAMPLTAPPLGSPAEFSVIDHAARTEYGTIHPPDLPPPLTVRGFIRGGTYQSVRAGFDAKHQLESGGIFGQLTGLASDGHLPDGAWSRTSASAGFVLEPNARSGVRLQITRRSREQDLPRHGTFTANLNPAGRVQMFRQWAGELRYRFEGRDGFTAGFALEGQTAGFESEQTARHQTIRDGTASVSLDMPLDARVVSIGTSIAIGGRTEELSSPGEIERRRLVADVSARIVTGGGFVVEGGVAYHKLGDTDVVGPAIRLTLNAPPTHRLWLGVAPYLREPDVLGFFDSTPYAAGALGQESEHALAQLEGGAELQMPGGLRLGGEAALRRSKGYAHADRADRGFYELATLDERFVLEVRAELDYRSPIGVGVEATYALNEIEGTRIPYVPKHRGRAGVLYRSRVELGVHLDWIGNRPTSPGEATRSLSEIVLLSASGAVEIASRWWLALEAQNLTDTYHREFAEYDAPGRRIGAGIRYTF